MRKLVLWSAAVAVAGFLAAPAWAQPLPSSKVTVAVGDVVDLGAACKAAGSATCTATETPDTGWVEIAWTYIKTNNSSDLTMNMALQCGLQTYTQVRSKNGSTGTSNAAGQMDVRVRVKNLGSDLASPEDDGPWINTIPSNIGGLGADPVDDVGVTYCYRFQELAATLTGINCTANLTTGAVTCDDPESISLLLDTFDAHSFNFLVADLQSGVHQISVEARARADAAVFSTSADPETIGAAKGRAFAGAGALIVEKGRLVKGQDTGLIQTLD